MKLGRFSKNIIERQNVFQYNKKPDCFWELSIEYQVKRTE